jgi:uncharacterized protein YndB with AHSA1/START domain
VSTQQGYFLIADITGYTQYLNASELEHAQQTLTTLLNLLISRTKPPLIISRLAGDAVISYGLRDHFLQGQTFVELLEDTYVAFRRTVELMVRNTTCPCNACRNIGSLDLKFFVHYGEFGVQKLDAHDELIGSDVNLIHRLLKNSVREATGAAAYTLYTDAAIRQLGLTDAATGFVSHQESYEHLGVVDTRIEDMHPVWEAKRSATQISVEPHDELKRAHVDIALPPEMVWNFIVQPDYFNVIAEGDRIEIAGRANGWTGPGSSYQCYHGGAVVSQLILNWQPFERIVFQFVVPVPFKGTTGLLEIRLEPVPLGTRLTQLVSRTTGPLLGRLMGDRFFKAMDVHRPLATLKTRLETEAGQGSSQKTTPPSSDAIRAAAHASLLEAVAQQRS